MYAVMLKSLQKKRENWKEDRKGFTLIELIVVIAILAILMAILVPTMSGIIGNARRQSAIADARSVYLAAQQVATEQIQAGTPLSAATDGALPQGNLTLAAITGEMDGSSLATKLTAGTAVKIDKVTISDSGTVTSVSITETGVKGDNGSTDTDIAYPSTT